MYWGKRPRVHASAVLVLLAAAYVLLVLGSSVALRGARIDLTADRLYTLSPGIARIVASLRQPMQLKLYFSDRASRDLPQLRAYRQRVGDMLDEIARRSNGRIQVQVVDPQPYSEDEDRAAAAGLIAVPGNEGDEKLYFGLTAHNLADGRSGAIPFFFPDREPLLEYSLAKLILETSQATRPRVDILSTLPIAGSRGSTTAQPQPAWIALQQLQPLFDVHMLSPANVKGIDPATRLLVLIGPRDWPDDALYAIDQYVLRGGRLLVFVDPDMELDAGRDADLPRLFRAWGVAFDPAQVVLDRDRALTIQPSNAAPVRHPAVLGFTGDDLNREDPITAALGTINVSSAGRIELAEGTHSRLIPLIQSSAAATVASAQRVRDAVDPSTLYDGYTPAGEHYAIAARVIGRFASAFPQRMDPGHLARATGESRIVLVADTDMLSDRLWVQLTSSYGQTTQNAFADNGDFFFNAVDALAGSPDLLSIPRRAVADRPFTTVDNLRRAADEKFKAKQNELLVELADTETRLAALQNRGGSGSDASQKAAVDQFVKRKLQIRAELREVQRQLDADIETLGARLKFIDILLMPILLTLIALAYGAWRARRRTGA